MAVNGYAFHPLVTGIGAGQHTGRCVPGRYKKTEPAGKPVH